MFLCNPFRHVEESLDSIFRIALELVISPEPAHNFRRNGPAHRRVCSFPSVVQVVGFRSERLQRADVLINPVVGLFVGFSRPLAAVVFSA